MSGMRGDDDEHPANNSADLRQLARVRECLDEEVYSQSNIIATAISIIST